MSKVEDLIGKKVKLTKLESVRYKDGIQMVLKKAILWKEDFSE